MNKKELIRKFLENQCSAEEAALATKFISEEPSLLDEILPVSEWNDAGSSAIPEKVEEEISTYLTNATRRGKVFTMLRPAAMVASVMALIVCAFLWVRFHSDIKGGAPVAQTEIAVPASDTIYNNGVEMKTIRLKDGSHIDLFGQSSVVYSRDFSKNRNIVLSGKARFHVAKNREYPFVVRSASITTTALGTVFMVDASDVSTLNVQLFEGKVVVKSVQASLAIEDTYLQPGEQCLVNMDLARISVLKINAGWAKRTTSKKVSVPVMEKEEMNLSLRFEKVALSETFKRLEKIFHTTIRYNGVALDDILFTGNFEPEDSLSQILRIIGNMNGLNVLPDAEGVITVSKKKKAAEEEVVMPVTGMDSNTHQLLIPYELPAADIDPAAIPEARSEQQQDALHPEGTMEKTAEGFSYRKIGIAQLLDRLAKENRIRIQYNREEIREIYFSGIVPDDLSSISTLKMICRMNGLKLIKMKAGNYSVKPVSK